MYISPRLNRKEMPPFWELVFLMHKRGIIIAPDRSSESHACEVCGTPHPLPGMSSVLLEVKLMYDCCRIAGFSCWYFPGRLGHHWVCQRPWSINAASATSSRAQGRSDQAHLLAPALIPDRSAALMLGRVAVCRHESGLLGELLSAACAALDTAASHVCSSRPLPAT